MPTNFSVTPTTFSPMPTNFSFPASETENASEYLNTTDLLNLMEVTPTIPTLPIWTMNIYYAFRGLWAILSILGNSMIIITVAKSKVLQKNSSYFICSLAVADIIMALVTPLEIIHQEKTGQRYHKIICLVDKTFNLMSLRGNYMSIFLIALDRMVYIVFPLRYSLIVTPKITFGIIGVLWLRFAIETPLIMVYGSKPDFKVCKYTVFVKHAVYFNYLLPELLGVMILTGILYAIIALVAYREKRKILAQNLPYDTIEANNMRKNNKILKMLLWVLALYYSSYVVQFIGATLLRVSITIPKLYFERCTSIIYYMNIWMNPVIYCWRYDDFRKALRRVLRRGVLVAPASTTANNSSDCRQQEN